MPSSRRKALIHYSLFPRHMRPLFLATLLRYVGDNLVGIFLPIFLFGIGQQLQIFSWLGVTPFISGVLFAVSYYALQRGSMIIIAIPISKLTYRIGYAKAMVLGTIFLGVNFAGLYFAKSDPRFLFLSAIAGGFFLITYWTAHDSLFAQEINVKEIGRGVGAMAFLSKLIQIVTPAVAGLVIAGLGYQVLLFAGDIFIDWSASPLLDKLGQRRHPRGYPLFFFRTLKQTLLPI